LAQPQSPTSKDQSAGVQECQSNSQGQARTKILSQSGLHNTPPHHNKAVLRPHLLDLEQHLALDHHLDLNHHLDLDLPQDLDPHLVLDHHLDLDLHPTLDLFPALAPPPVLELLVLGAHPVLDLPAAVSQVHPIRKK